MYITLLNSIIRVSQASHKISSRFAWQFREFDKHKVNTTISVFPKVDIETRPYAFGYFYGADFQIPGVFRTRLEFVEKLEELLDVAAGSLMVFRNRPSSYVAARCDELGISISNWSFDRATTEETMTTEANNAAGRAAMEYAESVLTFFMRMFPDMRIYERAELRKERVEKLRLIKAELVKMKELLVEFAGLDEANPITN